MRVCICGGGSLGHVCAAVFASGEETEVSILTNRPKRWTSKIEVSDLFGKHYTADIKKVSNDPAIVVAGADIVFLCQPGFLIEKTLAQIAPYLCKNAKVGTIVSSTGFFFAAHRILPAQTKLFGFQRTPFIARVNEYGKSASILGYKQAAYVAVENIEFVESFRIQLEHLFQTPISLLNNYLEASLTNSNPILHTGRLYSMFHNWDGTPFDHNILFYEEWTNDASNWIMKMDLEFMHLLDKLPVDKKNIPSLLIYYESTDAQSLTKKISSIKAFQGITTPMLLIEKGWVPDFNSRYFTEDFPFGLRYIKELADKYGVKTPIIDEVLLWGLNQIRSEDNVI